MGDDLLDQYRRRLPELFVGALTRLEQRASQGDQALRARLEQMATDPVVSLLRLEGEGGGELWLQANRRALHLASPPSSVGYGYALCISTTVARQGLALLERGGVDVEEATRGLLSLSSNTARELFSGVSFGFELEITNAPVVGSLGARVSLGRAALGTKPEFKLTVEYDELEDAREQGLTPHQLFLAGKIRIEGDVAKAMLLGMTLAQL